MDTQQNQDQPKKSGIKVNPSRDMKYDKEAEVELDRGGVEFSGGGEEEKDDGYQKGDKDAFDTAVKNAGSKGSAHGYEDNTPDIGMSSDLGGDKSQYSKQKPTKH